MPTNWLQAGFRVGKLGRFACRRVATTITASLNLGQSLLGGTMQWRLSGLEAQTTLLGSLHLRLRLSEAASLQSQAQSTLEGSLAL